MTSSRWLVLRVGGPLDLSARLPRRAALIGALAFVAVLAAVCLMAAFGEYPISIPNVLRAVIGEGSSLNRVVIREIRLPRIVLGALVGGALGLSGGVLQMLTRNPLASPDIIGVNQGAAVVAVALIIGGAGADVVTLGAFGGAMAAVLLIVLLGARRHLSFYRLILIGIAINVFGYAAVAYLLTKAPMTMSDALAQLWLLGSLAQPGWQDVRIMLVSLVVIAPVVFALARGLDVLALGEDLARAVGVRLRTTQLVLALLAALLAAAAVSVAGPISFVAFIAPHITRRVTRTAGAAALPAAMAIGALLLMLADYTGERILEPTELPVGITTVVLGAPYLLYLLLRAERGSGVA